MIDILSSDYPLQSPWISVRRDTVRYPSGKEGTYYVVERPSCVLVVPMIGNDVLLLRQFRHPVSKWCIEVVAGLIDQGEDPVEAAARELLEETGAVAGSMIHLATLDASPAVMNQKAHVFLASIDRMAEQHLEEEEVLQTMRVPFDEAVRMATCGEISGSLAVSAILLTDAHLHAS